MEKSNLGTDPSNFLKHYYGEKYIILSIQDHVTQYSMGNLDSVELAYLSKILELISLKEIQGSLE